VKDRTRMKPDTRREQVLAAAVREAERVGFSNVSRKDIAARAGCSEGLIRHYLGNLTELRRAIMGEAIRTNNHRVIAQGIVAGHPRCKKLTAEQKQAALAAI